MTGLLVHVQTTAQAWAVCMEGLPLKPGLCLSVLVQQANRDEVTGFPSWVL
jgi:hypothetical protein